MFELRDKIRELDFATDMKFDLLGLYEMSELTDAEKKLMATIIHNAENEEKAAEEVFEILNIPNAVNMDEDCGSTLTEDVEEEIQDGDEIVYNGEHLFVANADYMDLGKWLWVTDNEEDRYNKKASGWSLAKELVDEVIGQPDDDDDEQLDESLKDFMFTVKCNDGPKELIKVVAEDKAKAEEYAKKMYAQNHTTYADDRHNVWSIDEDLSSDIDKVKHAVDQFKGQVTVSKDSENDVGQYLLSKNISYMKDDSKSAKGKLTFMLKYPIPKLLNKNENLSGNMTKEAEEKLTTYYQIWAKGPSDSKFHFQDEYAYLSELVEEAKGYMQGDSQVRVLEVEEDESGNVVKRNGEVLFYSDGAVQTVDKELFDVATPQETADMFGKKVYSKKENKLYTPTGPVFEAAKSSPEKKLERELKKLDDGASIKANSNFTVNESMNLKEGWETFYSSDYDDEDVVIVALTDKRFSPIDNKKQRESLRKNNVKILAHYLNGVVVEGKVGDIKNVCEDCHIMMPSKILKESLSHTNVESLKEFYNEYGLKESEEDGLENATQEYTSANTSINSAKLPAIFSMVNFKPETINLDYGGGKFDNATTALEGKGVTNLVYDPYNRSSGHNKDVIDTVRKNGGADTVTCSNVLNVIKEPEARKAAIKNIYSLLKNSGTAYFTVYEGTGKGNEGPTKSGYQLNKKTGDYVEEISSVFPSVSRRGKLIIASKGASITEEFDDDWSDTLETGGEPTYCPDCGVKFVRDEEGDAICPKCNKTPYQLANERRKNESATAEGNIVVTEKPYYVLMQYVNGDEVYYNHKYHQIYDSSDPFFEFGDNFKYKSEKEALKDLKKANYVYHDYLLTYQHADEHSLDDLFVNKIDGEKHNISFKSNNVSGGYHDIDNMKDLERSVDDGLIMKNIKITKSGAKNLKNEALYGMNEIKQFVKMASQLGLKTMGDFKDFMDREGQGKDVITALYDYLHDEIGDLNFQAKDESLKEDNDAEEWEEVKPNIESKDGSVNESLASRQADTDAQEKSIIAIENTLDSLGIKVHYGTKIGKYPQTVILDIKYQDNAIYIISDGKVLINGDYEGEVNPKDKEAVKQMLIEYEFIDDDSVTESKNESLKESDDSQFDKAVEAMKAYWNYQMSLEQLHNTLLKIYNNDAEKAFKVFAEYGDAARRSKDESLKESKADIDNFINKFGKDSYELFKKSTQRMKNRGISTDLTYHVKNTDKKDLDAILLNLQNRAITKDGDLTELAGDYEYLGEDKGYKVYKINDVIASINFGAGTGWCISGRYGHYGEKNYKPTRAEAEKHWNDYTSRGVQFYFFIGTKDKVALALYPNTFTPDTTTSNIFINKTNCEIYNEQDKLDYSLFSSLPVDLINEHIIFEGIQAENGLYIKDNVLVKCDNSIKNVVIPDGITKIADKAFALCEQLKTVTIPNSVTNIGNWAFSTCSSLTSITIGSSVTSIGNGAFSWCYSLTSITIGSSVTSIGDYAFTHCSSLTSITIPNSVTNIGNWAFYDCTKLKNIMYKGTIAEWKDTLQWQGWNEEVPKSCTIHCTDGVIDVELSESLTEELDKATASTSLYIMYLKRLNSFKNDKDQLKLDLEEINKYGYKFMEPAEVEDLKNKFNYYINKLSEQDEDEHCDPELEKALNEATNSNEWEEVASKSVEDSDGFLTDYVWYTDGNKHVFIFGDSDIYRPEDGYFDWEIDIVEGKEAEAYKEAQDWFNSYNGFAEELDEAQDIYDIQGQAVRDARRKEVLDEFKEIFTDEPGGINLDNEETLAIVRGYLEDMGYIVEVSETQNASHPIHIEWFK